MQSRDQLYPAGVQLCLAFGKLSLGAGNIAAIGIAQVQGNGQARHQGVVVGESVVARTQRDLYVPPAIGLGKTHLGLL